MVVSMNSIDCSYSNERRKFEKSKTKKKNTIRFLEEFWINFSMKQTEKNHAKTHQSPDQTFFSCQPDYSLSLSLSLSFSNVIYLSLSKQNHKKTLIKRHLSMSYIF